MEDQAADTRERRGLLARNRSFRLLWFGDAASQVGSMITYIALPLVAILALDASSFEVGLLTAAGYAAWILVGLPAGALLDRRLKRPVMVFCDIGRAALVLSIPVAAALDALTLGQLYAVALGTGILTTVFDIAYPAYVPHIVDRSDLVTANARLQLIYSTSQISGPSVGGGLVQALTAPFAILVNTATFLISAVCLGRIDDTEPPPQVTTGESLLTQIKDGLRFVRRHRVIRSVMIASAGFNFFIAAHEALVVIFLVQSVGVSPGLIGVLLASAGIGGLVGASLMGLAQRRLGTVRLIWVVPVLTVPFGTLLPLTENGWGLAFFVVGALVPAIGVVAFNVAVGTFIQTLVPTGMLSRAGASIRVVTRSALPMGAFIGGAVALQIPISAALLAAALGMTLSVLTLLASPIRGKRELQDIM
ncbi:MFS transporter [Glycomyces sp. A-F 0318]|uniref:MFS transporter n=1 Tax=Glycomyces amatae TaxID=2881355 RepID=UPI001E6101B8|nr:MFS transporter [Glycomyces amatae]